MLPRMKEPRRLEKISRSKGLPESAVVDWAGCKQALVLPEEAYYCGIWKEKISTALCKYCPYYDKETPEYKLFRRE